MIKVEVHSTRAAIRSQEPLTVGLRGAKARFVFGADWDSLSKTAVFRQGDKTVTLADIGQEVTIPWEVLTMAGVPVQIGVFGRDAEGAVAIPTLWVSTQPVQPGADPEGDPSTEYSQPYWEQILQKTDSLANAIMEANRPVFSVTVSERKDGSNTADQDLQTILAKLDEGFSVTCYWYDKDVILPLINVHLDWSVAFAAVYDAMAYRVVIHQNGVQCTAVELAQKTDLPTKTSQLQNDSGYLTKAPVTGVNGKTGDVTIPTPIRVTIEQLADGSYQPDPPYDEIVEFHDQGNLLYCQYENLELPLTGVVPHFYTFSCVDGGKIHRVKIGPSSVTVSSEALASGGNSGAVDAVCYTPQELTEEQKAQARQNIGACDPGYVDDAIANIDLPTGNASQYRHIATIVSDSPFGGWKVEQDEDGNAFSLSHVFIRADLTASPEGRSDGYIKLDCAAKHVPWVFSTDTGDYKAVMEITMVGTNASMRYMSWGTAIKANRVEEYCYDSSESVITSIQHYTAAYHHGSGSKFEIWGY